MAIYKLSEDFDFNKAVKRITDEKNSKLSRHAFDMIKCNFFDEVLTPMLNHPLLSGMKEFIIREFNNSEGHTVRLPVAFFKDDDAFSQSYFFLK